MSVHGVQILVKAREIGGALQAIRALAKPKRWAQAAHNKCEPWQGLKREHQSSLPGICVGRSCTGGEDRFLRKRMLSISTPNEKAIPK